MMTKTIFSTVTLLLLLQGCDDSSSKNDNPVPSTKVSEEVKSFASTFKDDRSVGNSIGKSVSSASEAVSNANSNKQVQQKQTLKSCTDGGTKKITTDVDFDGLSQTETVNLLNSGFTITMDSDNCIEDGAKVDASMTMVLKINGELMTMNIKFNRDSTFEDLETTEILTVNKDSNMNIKDISDNEEMITENMKVSTSKGKNYESIALISHKIGGETTDAFYEVSGKRVDNGTTYSVDKNYDASKTPMVEEYDSGDLISGTAKYYNNENEHITVKVIGKNQIKVSVDSDNDGTDDAEEIVGL